MTDLINKVDLHIHSTYSDGSLTPTEIVESAFDNDIHAIALTDHDTIDGIGEALAAARQPKTRITMIPGVEISADYKYQLHILGYFPPDGYAKIGGFINEMKYERDQRNIGVVERLNNLGIKITIDEVAAIAGKPIFGRPHIAAVLVKKGIVDSQSAAFREYLAGGRKAYVKKRSCPPEECVSIIAQAGGLPVIAHPGLIGAKLSEIAVLTESLKAHGLFGLEVYYPEHTPKDIENFLSITRKNGLLATGGSDFHGDYRKNVKLGTGKDGNLYVPDDVPVAIINAFNSGGATAV